MRFHCNLLNNSRKSDEKYVKKYDSALKVCVYCGVKNHISTRCNTITHIETRRNILKKAGVGNRLVSSNKIPEILEIWLYSTICPYAVKHNSNRNKTYKITYFVEIKSRSCPINSFLLWYLIKGHGRISSSLRFTKILKR